MHSTAINSSSLIRREQVALAGPVRIPGSRPTSQRVQKKAEMLLARHPSFRGRTRFVQCTVVERCLVLNGCLPSYYLKQLAQEAMRGLKGINQIENRIRVASPVGEVRETNPLSDDSGSDFLKSKPR